MTDAKRPGSEPAFPGGYYKSAGGHIVASTGKGMTKRELVAALILANIPPAGWEKHGREGAVDHAIKSATLLCARLEK